jgi:hypothetical protein
MFSIIHYHSAIIILVNTFFIIFLMNIVNLVKNISAELFEPCLTVNTCTRERHIPIWQFKYEMHLRPSQRL